MASKLTTKQKQTLIQTLEACGCDKKKVAKLNKVSSFPDGFLLELITYAARANPGIAQWYDQCGKKTLAENSLIKTSKKL